jgi:hypothetical protein
MSFLWLPKSLRNGVMSPSAFSPMQSGKVTAWFRLAASTQSAGAWTTFVDVLGGASATPVATGPAVAASTNALPIATFTTNVLQWALGANNNDTIKFGIAGWFKLADVATTKTLAMVALTAGGASANKLQLDITTTSLRAIDQGVTGRRGTAGTLDTAWHFLYVGIDCSKATEATQVIMATDTLQTVTFTNDTAWPSALAAGVTGNMLIGASTTAAVNPFAGSMGPNLYFLNDQLTAAELLALSGFEAPT